MEALAVLKKGIKLLTFRSDAQWSIKNLENAP